MAEGVGFEPTKRRQPLTAFRVPRTRPDYATPPGPAEAGYLSHRLSCVAEEAAHYRRSSGSVSDLIGRDDLLATTRGGRGI